MIIVPELKKVFILVPRTGSGTLYRELQSVYPRSMLLYRHMEADGVPIGYDRWEKVGFVRHPLYRLWSLYRLMQTFGGGACVQGGQARADAERIRNQTEPSFEHWLLNNYQPWTVPYDLSTGQDFWPILSRRYGAPENRLSQWQYLRPDLGTKILHFSLLRHYLKEWGLNPEFVANKVLVEEPPVSAAIHEHLWKFCEWDIRQGCFPL